MSLFKKKMIKILALFTVVRGYNVLLLILGLYFTSFFVFTGQEESFIDFLKIREIHFIIIASALTVAGGYVINDFYDLKKDKLGRPITSYIGGFVSQGFKLNVYLLLNILAVGVSFVASWRVAVFFLVYQAMVWFYSHKISKIVFINNLFYTVLSLFPFVAILLYYGDYQLIIFFHGVFLALLLMVIDISKDLFTEKADLIYDYRTIASVYGEKVSKWLMTFILVMMVFIGVYMKGMEGVGYMRIYFHMIIPFLVAMSCVIWVLNKEWQYLIFTYVLKILLGIGVLSVAWIKINPLDLQKFFIVN